MNSKKFVAGVLALGLALFPVNSANAAGEKIEFDDSHSAATVKWDGQGGRAKITLLIKPAKAVAVCKIWDDSTEEHVEVKVQGLAPYKFKAKKSITRTITAHWLNRENDASLPLEKFAYFWIHASCVINGKTVTDYWGMTGVLK